MLVVLAVAVMAQQTRWLVVLVVSVFTCFLGSLVAVPVATFYIQNAAYHRGVLS